MLKLCTIALLILTIYLECSNAVSNPKVVCYYESWGYWRQGRGKMTVNDIDSSLCTHIVYAYLGITDNYQVHILDPYLMVDLHDFSNFSKKKGSGKAMIAIGGSAQSVKFGQMSQTDADRTSFVNSVVDLLKKYDFDGVMIDWQYPKEHDIENYVKLLDKFDEKFASTSFVLGITGASLKKDIDDGFNVKKITSYVDFIHVLTFDLHGPWDSQVDYAAPLDWQIESLKYWWEKGAEKHKLLMSIPLFARTWTLSKPENNLRKAGASGPGTAGPYTQAAGRLSYNELCTAMKEHPSEWNIRRDNNESAVIAMHGKEWISYEDSKTCAAKAKNATTEGYGGIVAYALTNDDFHGDCGDTKYPLLHGINSGLNHEAVKEGTPPPVTETTHASTHPAATDPPGVFRCHQDGKFMDPLLCYSYHVCTKTDIAGVWEDEVLHCDRTQGWDNTAQKCIDKNLVPGCKK